MYFGIYVKHIDHIDEPIYIYEYTYIYDLYDLYD